MARASSTSDVFNAIADMHRCEVLDALVDGQKAVGAIVSDLSMSQPQVSKHDGSESSFDKLEDYLMSLLDKQGTA
jgi:hypothetical protein